MDNKAIRLGDLREIKGLIKRDIENGDNAVLNAVNGLKSEVDGLNLDCAANNAEIKKKQNKITLVVGTTEAGHTESDVDFLCDGTNDTEIIQSAINSLPADGGRVLLLNGTYTITGNITIAKSYVMLEGENDTQTFLDAYDQPKRLDISCNAPNIEIKNLNMDNIGIQLLRGSDYTRLTRVSCVSVTANRNVKYTKIYDCGFVGDVQLSGSDAEICLCKIQGGKMTIGSRAFAARNSITTGCIYSTGINSKIIGNRIEGTDSSDGFGIYVSSGNNSEVSHNTVSEAAVAGIYVKTNNNLVTDNIISQSDFYSGGQASISVSGADNLIVNNLIPGKDYVDNSGGTTNTYANNKY